MGWWFGKCAQIRLLSDISLEGVPFTGGPLHIIDMASLLHPCHPYGVQILRVMGVGITIKLVPPINPFPPAPVPPNRPQPSQPSQRRCCEPFLQRPHLVQSVSAAFWPLIRGCDCITM